MIMDITVVATIGFTLLAVAGILIVLAFSRKK